MRIGQGYDVHKLVQGRDLILGGVNIPYEKGLLGHSDADVLVHAVMDALLGAAALGDIGQHFPDTDPAYKGISSIELLKKVGELLDGEGYVVENIDATIIAQRPKLAQFRPQMAANIADALHLDVSRVSVKATTEEGLGFTGTGEGISSQAITLLTEPADYCYDNKMMSEGCKSCPGCGKIITSELEAVVYQQMVKKLASYKTLTGRKKAAKANPKIAALQVELAHVDGEIEKLVDSLTGANNVLLSYVNVKIAELDGRKQELLARIAELTVEAISPEQVSQISGYLDTWENVSFDDKRRVVDLMITTIAATSDSLNIIWKI